MLVRPEERDAPEGTLAPTIFTGERLPPDADLAAAMAATPDGGALALAAGVYRLRAGYSLYRALVLDGAGAGRTRVVCDAPDFVLRVMEEGHLRATGIAFEHEGRKPADVLVAEAGELELTDCTVAGGYAAGAAREGGRHGRGLVVAGAASATLRRVVLERNARDGLAVLDEAAASVRGWTSRQNQGLGALAAGRAYLALADGRAENNFLGGIAYRDDARGEVRQARCLRGGGFGIALFHRARVAIEGCELADNRRSGLAYWHGASGSARGCTVARNGEHGVEVRDDATPHLEGNEVTGNRAWGVVFADRAGGAAIANAVAGNAQGDVRVLDAAAPRR